MPHNRAVEAEPGARSDEAPTEGPLSSARPQWWWRLSYGRRIAVGVGIYLVVAFLTVVFAPAALLNNWVPGLSPVEQGKLLGAAGNLVLLALGGVIAVVTVGISMSRHRQELEAAERDRERLRDDRERELARRDEGEAQRRIGTERALGERFVTTVKLLSDPAPVNRQAALFALGALADDWDAFGRPEQVQVCIEVLTGYLRAPRSDDMVTLPTEDDDRRAEYFATRVGLLDVRGRRDPRRTTPQEIAVKQAGYAVIHSHLHVDAIPSWHHRALKLAGAHIDFSVDLTGVTIGNGGHMDLTNTTINPGGHLDLTGATINDRGYVDLTGATIDDGGYVDLTGATITHGRVTLTDATISGGGYVFLTDATICNDGYVFLTDATIGDGGSVFLTGATITHGGCVDLTDATIGSSGSVYFTGATIGDRGSVYLPGPRSSSSGNVYLGVKLGNAGTVYLAGATLSNRQVQSFPSSPPPSPVLE